MQYRVLRVRIAKIGQKVEKNERIKAHIQELFSEVTRKRKIGKEKIVKETEMKWAS